MAQTFSQWVLTAAETLNAIGQGPPRVGSQIYFQASSQGPSEFFLVEKVRTAGRGLGYMVFDTKAFRVSEEDIRNFLEGQGEVLPATIRVFVRTSTPAGLILDEIVVVDDSSTITRL